MGLLHFLAVFGGPHRREEKFANIFGAKPARVRLHSILYRPPRIRENVCGKKKKKFVCEPAMLCDAIDED